MNRRPKICIVGPGAIGALLGVRLAEAGCDVSVLARGATLAAVQAQGLGLQDLGASRPSFVPVRASDEAGALGVQDLVLPCVKAPALPTLAPLLQPLVGPRTRTLSTQNGLPWWFGPASGAALHSVDPQGVIDRALPWRQALGAVGYFHARRLTPGVSQALEGRRLVLGEPAGGLPSTGLDAVAGWLQSAGFEVAVSSHIRREVWTKLWGTMTVAPLSVLSRATVDRILADPLVEQLVLEVMQEAADLGAAIGCPLMQTAQERNDLTRSLGAFKTSMLRDAEAGAPIELDALVGAVHELGQQRGLALPRTDLLFGIARLHARVHGLYPEAA